MQGVCYGACEVIHDIVSTELQYVKLGRFAMPQTCENWLCLANGYVYHACQTHGIYQVLPNSTDFHRFRSSQGALKGSFEIQSVRQYDLE